MYYSSIGIVAFLVHVIINYDVLVKSKHEQDSDSHKAYKAFLTCVLIYYIFDILWGVIYSLKFPLLSYTWTELYFMTVAITVFLWTRYVIIYLNKATFFSKLIKYAGILFLVFEFVSIILNLFFPIMFYYDEKGDYHTGKARTATMFAQILLFFGDFYLYAYNHGQKSWKNPPPSPHYRGIRHSHDNICYFFGDIPGSSILFRGISAWNLPYPYIRS
ncbi:MAG: hypothetical protein IJ257_07345 [Treponema sp.]|nr:hypothetical protein [Treponema sp.]